MKQCPKCSSTYANDKQKFCTKDGTALVDALEPSAGQDTTIRIDSTQLDDEITKVISQPLPRMSEERFDPYKTNVSTPQPQPTPPPPPPIASPPAAAPPPPAAAPTVSVPAPPSPSQRNAPPPTVASNIANIASQSTNASIAADTVQAVGVPLPPPTATASVPQPAVQQTRKRSKLPLILGILFVLLLIGAGGVVAGYFFVVKPMLDKKRASLSDPQPTPMVVTMPDVGGTKPQAPKTEAPPYSPPANAVQFVNSNTNLTGRLAEHYVDFSFYYPNRWRRDPEAGTTSSTNFAKVQRELAADAPQEIFAIGWYDSTGARDTDELSYPRLVAERSQQFAKQYPEYEKVSDGPARAGPYGAYEFRFKGVYRHTDRGDVQIWGRVMFVPPVEGTRGVTLLMLASSLAPEVKSVDDVGVKGDLPMMLESFRFGK
jgi:hypothetical protein